MRGWKFWPERDPEPVDGAFVQVRWIRPYLPGPIRVLVTGAIGGLAVFTAFSGFLSMLGRDSAGGRLVFALITIAVSGSLALLGSRVLSTGVWVNDSGVRVLSVVGSEVFDWSTVADVRRVPGATRLLGSPLRGSGESVWLILKDGTDRETPLTDRSCDFLARPQAYDMAAGAVERWFEETR